MPARRFHGISHISFGTSSGAKTNLALAYAVGQTDVTDINTQIAEPGIEGGEASMLEYVDQDGNPKDNWGNNLAGVQYVKVTIRARDLTAYNTLKGYWDAGTPVYWRFILDNDERWHTDTAVTNWDQLKQVPVRAEFKGVSNQFSGSFFIPEMEITVTT